MQARAKTSGRGGKRRGAGRKPAVGHHIRLRLPKDVFARLSACADEQGLTPAVWVARHLHAVLPAPGVSSDSFEQHVAAPELPKLSELPMPPRAAAGADVRAEASYEAAMGGLVLIIEEKGAAGPTYVVWYFPEGSEESPTHVLASSREHAEIVARQTALATTPETAGGHGLLG